MKTKTKKKWTRPDETGPKSPNVDGGDIFPGGSEGKQTNGEGDEGDEESEEAGFHFIAYVPAHNHLWRLDGLQREPESLGLLNREGNDDGSSSTNCSGFGSDWLTLAAAEISSQWQSASEKNDMDFSLLSLCLVPADGHAGTAITDSTSVHDNQDQKEGGDAKDARALETTRLREDWGPALAQLVRILASQGEV
jgi:hypothetical protein